MSPSAHPPEDRRRWSIAAAVALCAHAGVAALVLTGVRPARPPEPEPVVLVELPPEGAAAPAPAAPPSLAQPRPQPDSEPPQTATPPVDIPPVRTPLPSAPVTLPPPATLPVQEAGAAPAPPVRAASPAATPGRSTGANTAPGSDPRARKQEADYFALVSAHLDRRKIYPSEARKARQQGVVTVRFTVDRTGAVSGTSIKRSSGHEILDRATLDLLQRVAPLPRMPSSMQRESITLSLPIDYSLRTN